jgi:hypothetical protein
MVESLELAALEQQIAGRSEEFFEQEATGANET